MEKLKIKLLREGAQIPKRATHGSAGFDLNACVEKSVFINPDEIKMIPTGISIQLEDELYVGLIFARSSMAVKNGVIPANAVGVIDSDYRGEIIVALKNSSSQQFQVSQGDRIAQFLVLPISIPEIEVCGKLESSDRGEGGFGSTGF